MYSEIKWIDRTAGKETLRRMIGKKVYLRENKYAEIKKGILKDYDFRFDLPFVSYDYPLMAFGQIGIKESENVNTNA